jgi:hypothetical protein
MEQQLQAQGERLRAAEDRATAAESRAEQSEHERDSAIHTMVQTQQFAEAELSKQQLAWCATHL